MLNRAQLIGHVGQKPEIRSTQTGGRIANFSLATSERWKDRASGEQQERTEWHRIVVFNEHLVAVVERFVGKGSKLFVEGKLQTRKWADNSGVERYTTEIVLAAYGGQIVLLDRASDGTRPPAAQPGDYGGYNAPSTTTAARARPASGVGSDLDDEIPF